MINLALFGAGRIGSVHGVNVSKHPNAALVALHDPFKPNADRLAGQLGCKQMTPEQIFADQSIDAILICSATDTHADLIERAAQAQKHVFCEKPVDLSLQRTRECVRCIAQSDVRVMIAFNRRFDPNFQRLQQRITSADLGEVELVSIISKDPAPPPIDYIKTSGGLFHDMTIHDFDMARFLLSEDIITVNAQAACNVDAAISEAGDIDTAIINMVSATGKLVQISNSRRAGFGYDQRIEVHGSEAMLIAQNVSEDTLVEYNQSGVIHANPVYFFLERYAAAYRTEIDHFIRALMGETVDLPTIEDGLKSLMMAEAALMSYRQNRNVSLSEISQYNL